MLPVDEALNEALITRGRHKANRRSHQYRTFWATVNFVETLMKGSEKVKSQ